MSDFYQRVASMPEVAMHMGAELGVSRWFEITQERIDAFAAVTEDEFFIHTDPERARAAAPYGGTIAQGFLTASLIAAMAYDAVPRVEGADRAVNYGFDRLRFVSPVPSGSRVRGRFKLTGMQIDKPGEVTLSLQVTVEIADKDRPALVADWITRQYFHPS
jgi:acyl dehydratase